MRVAIFSAAAVAAVSFAGAAQAQIERLADGRCFDKGALEYVPCPAEPEIVVAPIVEEPPASESGFYIGLRGGAMWLRDQDFDFNDGLGLVGTGPINVTNEFDMGYAVSGFIGYAYADWIDGFTLRPEIEFGYQAADIDSHIVGGSALAGPTGDASVLFGFVNLYGDIELAPRLDLILGGGVGAGSADLDNYGVAATGQLLDDDNVAFGYHLDAGLGYEVVEDLTLEAMYRYSRFVGGDIQAVDGTSSDFELDSHQALIGLRYRFN